MKGRNLGLLAAIIFWAIAIGWAFWAYFVTVAHAGSGGQAAMMICMSHVTKVDNLKSEGMTREQMHENFNAWLAGAHGEDSAANEAWYPPMVHAMIDAAFNSENWQHDALRACVTAANGRAA